MKAGLVFLLVLLLAAFLGGLFHLFALRFEGGDVYPAYSSLRADPLGARALHDSLAELLPVRRNFETITRLGDGRNTTLLYLGENPARARFTTNQIHALETFVRTGGRLVFSFSPETSAPRPGGLPPPQQRRNRRRPPAMGTNQPPVRRAPAAAEEEDWQTVSIQERWQLRFGYLLLERGSNNTYRAATARRQADADLPAELAVHTALHFENLNAAWQVWYARRKGTNEYPVLIERRMGDGAIVLTAESYPFSNEALRQDRSASLLAWFIGGRDHVVFEETHLGTETAPGIAAMARQYHLHGFAAALALLAGLFIWRNSCSFMPPPEEELADEASHQVAGKDSAEGFINLLRRNVPPGELLKACIEQWNQTAALGRKPSQARLQAMQQLVDEQNDLPPNQRNPVRTYQQFCEILTRRT